MERGNFLFISYSLPSEPSRIRVSTWRWLKKIGALNIQKSLWLLPDTEDTKDSLKKIKDYIENEKGSVYIASGNFLYGKEDIKGKFIDEINREYEELLGFCTRFHEEMKKETQKENFTFAELEENDEELKKLYSWFEKINKRDYFKSEKGEAINKEIQLCSNEFEEFSKTVYERNNIV
ncbi:MAG: chromate resistance protein ChrB [Clostridiales bacterium]|mgnify:CR=1 FL=1|nr:chromate resistance protein ChrB [Clostridiales bacterium]HBM79609.1 chromate resistance protein ChrB [Clostridiaceae bacterium]